MGEKVIKKGKKRVENERIDLITTYLLAFIASHYTSLFIYLFIE